jgi:hypothetical protein
MKFDTKCCMCGRLDAQIKEAKALWRELKLEETRSHLTEAGSAREMTERVLALETKKQLTVVMLLWF